jgi:sugar lactone lactonase YvrE
MRFGNSGGARALLRSALLATALFLPVAASSQTISTLVGGAGDGGPGSSVPLQSPVDVAWDVAGGLYIVEGSGRIGHLNLSSGIYRLLATVSGTARGVAIGGGGAVFVSANHQILRVDPTTGAQTLFAGRINGAPGNPGDGGPAVSATAGLNTPCGLAFDAAGNLFIADRNNDRIRRVDAVTGIISTVAGNGTSGYGGDGGLATLAALYRPEGIAIDSAGNLYIADNFNNRVRKVDAISGAISTLASTARAAKRVALRGDGTLAVVVGTTLPSIASVDAVTGTVSPLAGLDLPGYSGDGGPATVATFTFPSGMAVAPNGDLFIADSGNDRVRKIAAADGVITTVAGVGSTATRSLDGVSATLAKLYSPAGLAVDGDGNILVVEKAGHRLRRVHGITGQISTLAGTGAAGYVGIEGVAAVSMLSSPDSVAVAGSGDIYITDTGNKCVRRISAGTGFISRFAGIFCGANAVGEPVGDGGLATSASVRAPRGIVVDEAGNVLWTDPAVDGVRVRRVNTSNIISTVAGGNGEGYLGDGTLATAARLNQPRGLARHPTSGLFIADSGNHRVRRVDAVTGIILTEAGNGSAEFSGDDGPGNVAGINAAESMIADAAGNLYIADTGNHRVRRVDLATGTITTLAGTGVAGYSPDGTLAAMAKLNSPHGLAFDSLGRLLVSDRGNNLVRRIPVGGGPVMTVAGTITIGLHDDGETGPAVTIGKPSDLVRDSSGDIYFVDAAFHVVRRWEAATGRVTTLAGDGTAGYSGDGDLAARARLNSPSAIALDATGNIFVSDYLNFVIRRIDKSTGIISTFAGNGSSSDTGDDGAALSAGIVPGALLFDASGNLLVRTNARVRRIDSGSGTITTLLGNGVDADSGDDGPAASASISGGVMAGGPLGLAMDGAGNLFVSTSSRIRRVDATLGTVTTVAGGGAIGALQDGIAANTAAIAPSGIAIDASGNIFFGDASRVRMVVASTGTVATVAGATTNGYGGDNGPAIASKLNGVSSVRVGAAGNLLIADSLNGRIRAVAIPATGALTVMKAGSGAGTVSSSPAGIDCGADCDEAVAFGAPVTLAATPDAYSTFTGWSGDCTGTGPCVLFMRAAMQVTATFGLQACQPGAWSATGNAPCTPSSPGHYVSGPSATGQTACSPGSYQPSAGSTGCLVAQPGHFVAAPAATSQAACAAGTYQPAPGQTACLVSPAGSFVGAPGAISPTACAAGRYQPETGQSACLLADPGRYVPGTGAVSQVECAAGSYQPNAGASFCPPTSPGHHAPVSGLASQVPCAAGSYQPAMGATSCIPAPAGSSVSSAGASAATPCAAGTFQPGTGATSCIPASLGHHVPTAGAISETPCAPGSYQQFTGQNWCALAAPGYFVPEAGAVAQTACPAGRTTYEQGAAACVPFTTRGDANRDGRADIFWREAAAAEGVSWWTMNGPTLISSNYHAVSSAWQIADVGDLDGDNKADIVWRRASDGATYLWTLDGMGFKGFHDLGILDPAQWSLAGVADLNGDGKADIVWRGADGTVYAWLMDGGTIASQGVIANPGPQWVIADLADMDGDGREDILFRNTNDGGLYIFFMNGLSIASGALVGVIDPGWALVGAADFDGDGKGDLLWRHWGGDTWVWLMNGAAIQVAASVGDVAPSWQVQAIGDFDADGRADLVWRHTDGTTYLWKMNGASVAAYLPVANPGGSWEVVAP